MALSQEARARLEPDAAQIIGRYPVSRSALLPLLHLMQAEEGYLSEDGIEFCAGQLGLTKAEVTAVASFYTMYKHHPVGDYHVGVCTNSLCGVMGATPSWLTCRSTSASATTRRHKTARSAWSTWNATRPATTRRW